MQDLDWDDMRVFHGVAEAGSFARAATALGQHETTVARHVRRLEQRLGHILWRGPEAGVTDEGAALLLHARRMADAAAHAQAELGGRISPQGNVRVTAVPWVVGAGLLPELPVWSQTTPEITLSLLSAHDSLDVLRGDADIALRLARPDAHADVIVRKLCEVPFVVDGTAEPWIGYVPEMAHLPQAQWTDEAADRVSLRLSDQDAVTFAVHLGLGRAWVPHCMARTPDPAFGTRSRALWCLTHPRTRHAPAVRAVCDTLLPLVVRRLCG
ncbi:LysR family transcriptional regulator [Tateyamaria sp. SN3-11]|uniref:LysR family transcriptional regulator n=1 Tax=Tateyamaria sp. SN3-11 TaxID=3092147 RepID=UPI0039E9C3F1